RSYSPDTYCDDATPTSSTYALSLHDALPISRALQRIAGRHHPPELVERQPAQRDVRHQHMAGMRRIEGTAEQADLHALLDMRHRSEEHTSELQSRENLVCRLLLEKKNQKNTQ